MAKRNIIDLEETVQKWAWDAYLKTRSKSKLELEKAYLDINWSHVNYKPRKPNYTPISQDIPSSRTIFKSVFRNNCSTTQNHSLKVERQTVATCTSSLTKGCSKGLNIGLTLAAPGDVAEASVGFEKGFSVENAIESTDEKTLTWATEGSLAVPGKSALTAELQIKEKQRSFIFSTSVVVSGKVNVSIYDREDRSKLVMFVTGDIAEVILADKNIKGVKKDGNVVFIDMEGECHFRFGIEQEIKCY